MSPAHSPRPVRRHSRGHGHAELRRRREDRLHAPSLTPGERLAKRGKNGLFGLFATDELVWVEYEIVDGAGPFLGSWASGEAVLLPQRGRFEGITTRRFSSVFRSFLLEQSTHDEQPNPAPRGHGNQVPRPGLCVTSSQCLPPSGSHRERSPRRRSGVLPPGSEAPAFTPIARRLRGLRHDFGMRAPTPHDHRGSA